jgi:hypothetical protein
MDDQAAVAEMHVLVANEHSGRVTRAAAVGLARLGEQPAVVPVRRRLGTFLTLQVLHPLTRQLTEGDAARTCGPVTDERSRGRLWSGHWPIINTSISPSRMLAAAAMNPVAVSSMIVVRWSLSSW